MIVSAIIKQMQDFYKMIASDARIGASHVSIYMALLQKWNGEKESPLELHRQEIMRTAKISARQTYNKCMNDLKRYGYIRYMPSTGRGIESIIYLNALNSREQEN